MVIPTQVKGCWFLWSAEALLPVSGFTCALMFARVNEVIDLMKRL